MADNPQNILGYNSSNNMFVSTDVVANADGSMIERQEYIQDQIAALTTGDVLLQGVADAGTNSTTAIPIAGLAGYGNDFFNTRFYMQVLKNANSATAAPEAEVRQITDYVSSTGTFTCTAFSAAVEASDICLILHESQVAVGRDDANNTFASTNVAANADGSVLERLEAIKDQVDAVDNFVDTEVAAIKVVTDALPDAGALTTIDANIDSIKDYLSGVDSASNVLGADNNNNAFASTNVAANADGSVLERLEDIKVRVDTVDDYVDTEVAAIKTMTDKIGTVTNSGGTASIGAILGDANNSNIVTRIAAVKTEADKIGTITNTAGTATLGAVLGDVANSSVATRLTNAQTELNKIGTVVNAGGTATIGAVLGDMANSPVVTRFGNIQTEVNKIGTVVNAGGTATLGAVLGDAANVDIVTRVAALQTAVDNFAAGGGIGSGIVRKTVTFSNTAADVNLFTVTGTIIARLVSVCTTNVESAAGCNVGVDAGSVALIADTNCTILEAGDIWHDATPDASAELVTVMKEYIIANGTTILLDVETAKQVDSGVVEFYLIWTALSSNGAVAAAA